MPKIVLDNARKDLLKSEPYLDHQLRYLQQKHGIVFKNRTATCPFHDDKKPSLRYHPNDQGYVKFHCFGCNYDEDIYQMIIRLENIKLPQAIRIFSNFVEEGGQYGHDCNDQDFNF